MKNTSVGIIGLGSFGNLVASLLTAHTSFDILGFDIHGHTSDHARSASFHQVATADIVILAIPLTAYPAVLEKLRPILPATSLLIDVCSV